MHKINLHFPETAPLLIKDKSESRKKLLSVSVHASTNPFYLSGWKERERQIKKNKYEVMMFS